MQVRNSSVQRSVVHFWLCLVRLRIAIMANRYPQTKQVTTENLVRLLWLFCVLFQVFLYPTRSHSYRLGHTEPHLRPAVSLLLEIHPNSISGFNNPPPNVFASDKRSWNGVGRNVLRNQRPVRQNQGQVGISFVFAPVSFFLTYHDAFVYLKNWLLRGASFVFFCDI